MHKFYKCLGIVGMASFDWFCTVQRTLYCTEDTILYRWHYTVLYGGYSAYRGYSAYTGYCTA